MERNISVECKQVRMEEHSKNILDLYPKKFFLPAHKVSDNIGMTDQDIVGICSLISIGTVKVLPESSLNSSTIFVKLLIGFDLRENVFLTAGCIPATKILSTYG